MYVYVFDSQDQLVRKFGSRGILDSRFDDPVGLAFDADDNFMWCVDITIECNSSILKENIFYVR